MYGACDRVGFYDDIIEAAWEGETESFVPAQPCLLRIWILTLFIVLHS